MHSLCARVAQVIVRSAKKGCIISNNSVICNDGNACTTSEVCNNLNCVKKAVVCNDNNLCTADSCDAVKGCQAANIADKTDCGGSNWCIGGQCIAKAFCGDGIVNQASEECDDGNLVDNDNYLNSCKKVNACANPAWLVSDQTWTQNSRQSGQDGTARKHENALARRALKIFQTLVELQVIQMNRHPF